MMREELFHRLWEHHAYNGESLKTTCGKQVQIETPGLLNHFDGPDFPKARLFIDGLSFFGSVELHIRCNDWYLHGHESDPNYNNVILHVVLHPDDAGPVRLQDGTTAPTLILFPHLHSNWQTTLFDLHQQNELSCAGFLSQISPKVIDFQLNQAADVYFSVKHTELMELFDTKLPPSEAFLKMFWVAWCDGLGIPNNREPMKELAQKAWNLFPSEVGREQALKSIHAAEIGPPLPDDDLFLQMKDVLTMLSGLKKTPFPNSLKPEQWNFKGGRPVNNPQNRINQAAELLWFLKSAGLGWFLKRTVFEAKQDIGIFSFAAGERGHVLNHVVLLPSMFIIGSMYHKFLLCEEAKTYWKSGKQPVPKQAISPFLQAGGRNEQFGMHPGTLPQFRYYCKKNKCESCFIFKNILRG
ncbi:MAG: DUF2851 family protein [Balneolales bacterium]|nr:DUF2851 family protein [Balneolales bacterium]